MREFTPLVERYNLESDFRMNRPDIAPSLKEQGALPHFAIDYSPIDSHFIRQTKTEWTGGCIS